MTACSVRCVVVWLSVLLPASALVAQDFGATSDETGWPAAGRQFFGCGRRVRHCAPYDMQALVAEAAGAIVRTKNRQIRNGEILDRTLWNHHFQSRSDDPRLDPEEKLTEQALLAPSGIAALNRLARAQRTPAPVEVFVATAHDLPFDTYADQPDKFAADRDRLDAARAQAVADYLRVVLRRENALVLLHDPAPVGMVAEESSLAYKRGLNTVTSASPSFGDMGGGFGGGLGGFGGSPGGFGGSPGGFGGSLGGFGSGPGGFGGSPGGFGAGFGPSGGPGGPGLGGGYPGGLGDALSPSAGPPISPDVGGGPSGAPAPNMSLPSSPNPGAAPPPP